MQLFTLCPVCKGIGVFKPELHKYPKIYLECECQMEGDEQADCEDD